MAKTKQAAIVKVPFWQDDRKMAWVFFGFAFLLYAQTIGHDYALDDRAVTYSNKFVMDGFGGIGQILKTFYWAGFWESNSGLFRPISLILFAIEWQLFHNSPHVFHFVNVALYAFCSYQLYRLLRQLFSNQSITLSIIATAIWIAMPVHTEVAANIKSADEIFSVLFFLLSFRKMLDWSLKPGPKSLAIACVWMFLSLLSKEGAVLFVPALFIGLMLFRDKTIKQLIKPGIVFSIVVFVWFGWHSWVIASAPTEMIKYDYHNNALLSNPSVIDRFGTAIGMQGRYWLKMLIGYPLSYNYSFNEIPVDGFKSVWAWFSLAGIGAALFIAYKNFRKFPVLVFGILFYFIAFALTSNIFYLIGDTFADRLTFAPSIGFAIVLSFLILKFTNGLQEKKIHSRAIYVLIPILLFYSIRTFSRSGDWKYESTLFTADVENAPGSARVHYNYGVLLLGNATATSDEYQKKQFHDQAYNEFITAFKIDSNDVQSCYNLGVVEYRRKNYSESEKWSRMVLKINPKDVSVLGNLADAIFAQKKYDAAIVAYKNAIVNNVITEDTWNMYGFTYLSLGDTAEALEAFENSVKHDPKSAKNWDKLANVAGMSGNYRRSNEAFLEIARLNPGDPNPYFMIHSNYLRMGDTTSALNYLQEYRSRGGK